MIIHAGPPYTTDDRDSLGQSVNAPAHHAMNCLKIALRLKHSMPKIQKVYEKLLTEIAMEIEEKTRSGSHSRTASTYPGSPARSSSIDLNRFCARHNIPRQLSVTQGIASGKATVGLVRDTDSGVKTYSSSYTVIGDEMNIAARLQSKANPEEMIINRKTKELIEKAIDDNLPVPFNRDNQAQTWEEFKKELLGDDFGDYDLVPMFEETMLDLKHKQGYEYAFRLTFEKIARVGKRLPDALTEEELRNMPGYYKVISDNSMDRKVEVLVENMLAGGGSFKTTINNPPTETRNVTRSDFDRRVRENCDFVLKVKNGRIVKIKYVPVDNVIDEELEKLHRDTRIYEPGQIPDGIYTVKRKFKASRESVGETQTGYHSPETMVLEVDMNGITLMVQVNDNEILDLRDIKDRPKAQTLYEIHSYSHRKRKSQSEQSLGGFVSKTAEPEEVLFIHSSGEYIGNPKSIESIFPPKAA